MKNVNVTASLQKCLCLLMTAAVLSPAAYGQDSQWKVVAALASAWRSGLGEDHGYRPARRYRQGVRRG
jgi:hypothetical protein